MRRAVPGDSSFALCLTHDVDRPFKRWQAPYHALADRSHHHLKALLPGIDPWWQFDRVRTIESELGVRSAWYFLQERPVFERSPAAWTEPRYWIESLGRYDLKDPEIAEVIRGLDEGGWEVGVHGSIGSHTDANRLRTELAAVDRLVDQPVVGIRQHHLELKRPETWRIQRRVGLRYDTTLGSADSVGFEYGYEPFRPFDDEFVVFPTTIMDKALDAVTNSTEDAWEVCESLLAEAREQGAVMTVLWHLRNFCERDYPNFGDLYRRLIDRALEMDAWVGPPGQLYARLAPPVEA